MTYRKVISWGLIAGFTMSDMRQMKPGFILDAFIYRRNYDDSLRGGGVFDG